MKKYSIKVNDQRFTVEVEQMDSDKLNIKVDNNIYTVGIEEIISLNKIQEIEETKIISNQQITHNVGLSRDEKKSLMLSPLNGVVKKVFITQNRNIAVGDPVCIVEAMKMESEIFSSIKGKIKDIFIKQNEPLKLHQTIFSVE